MLQRLAFFVGLQLRGEFFSGALVILRAGCSAGPFSFFYATIFARPCLVASAFHVHVASIPTFDCGFPTSLGELDIGVVAIWLQLTYTRFSFLRLACRGE